ncbi:hypothetical protein B0T17DRAFT_505933 [Bombardia bombarda]|uniref:Uncharacterized protein n=1 Tax=Bombardia bombarda TaxID=252184 RepID=A0AA39X9T8_9PEZI|nr:hypothetical protein B0T17DRAFT_505933 [Bombardia bombarda]
MGAVNSTLASYGSSVASFLSFKTLAIIFVLTNIKSLHFMWFLRFLLTFTRRLTSSLPQTHLSPACLFLPAINTTRSPLLECDYNMHKSNSTYFTDMDMSRGNFCLALFGKPFHPFPGPKHFNMVLGGTTCVWRKEIKPYEPYELWTRVLSWDEKWLYVVTHFVKKGVFAPGEYLLQPGKGGVAAAGAGAGKRDDGEGSKERALKAVFASSVARYVFKSNRKTVPPHEVLLKCGLLPEDDNEGALAEVERVRADSLAVGRLESGWDSVHACFEPGSVALGKFACVY